MCPMTLKTKIPMTTLTLHLAIQHHYESLRINDLMSKVILLIKGHNG